MINQAELVICRRRGHSVDVSFRAGWVQCKWCRLWLREVCTVEEREDMPPEDEQNPLLKLRRDTQKLVSDAEKLND
jgi:hypothetical protein